MFTTILSPQALRERLGDPQMLVLDCRHLLADFAYGRRSYDAGHIPGAFFAAVEEDLAGAKNGRNGRHPLPDPEAFASFLRSLGAGDATQVVAYDDGADMFAARLWLLCRWIGHDAVAVLDGGLKAWQSLGYPVTTALPVAPGSGSLRVRLRPELVVGAAYVAAHLDDPAVHLLDARASDRFAGENETLDPVAGHIPGARNHWFKRNFDDAGTFKTPEQLHADYAPLGAPRDVVHQCGSGVSSAVNMLAMELAGLSGSRVYAGSWSEWIADPSHPVARGAGQP